MAAKCGVPMHKFDYDVKYAMANQSTATIDYAVLDAVISADIASMMVCWTAKLVQNDFFFENFHIQIIPDQMMFGNGLLPYYSTALSKYMELPIFAPTLLSMRTIYGLRTIASSKIKTFRGA